MAAWSYLLPLHWQDCNQRVEKAQEEMQKLGAAAPALFGT